MQARVNEKLGVKPKSKSAKQPAKKQGKKSLDTLVAETLAGKHGNGEARKKSLGSDYQAVQDVINGKRTVSGSTSSKKSASSSSSVKVGQKVTATKLYATSASTKNVRKSPISGTIDTINNSWRNPIRLKNNSGQYIGFTRKQDLA